MFSLLLLCISSSLVAEQYCLYFNGTDQWVDVRHSVNSANQVIPRTGDFTVEVWAKAEEVNGLRNIVSQNPGVGFNIGMNDGKVRCGDDWNNTGVPYPDDGLWHHFALVKTSDNTHLYLDGILKASKGSAIRNPGAASDNNFRIGRQCWNYAEYFHGYITDVRIWNTARTQTQIQQNMYSGVNSEAVSLTTGLRGHYRFNEGSGSTLVWRGSINMNGTLQSMSDNNWHTADLSNIKSGSYIIYTPQKGTSNAPYSQRRYLPWGAAMENRPITGPEYGFLWSENDDSTSFAGFTFNTTRYGYGGDYNLIHDLAWYSEVGDKREMSAHVKLADQNINNNQIVWTDRLALRSNWNWTLLYGTLFSSQSIIQTVYIKDGQLKFQHSSKWIDLQFTIDYICNDKGWVHSPAVTLHYRPEGDHGELTPVPVSLFQSESFVPITVDYVKTEITGSGTTKAGRVGINMRIGKHRIYFGNDISNTTCELAFDASSGWHVFEHYIDFPGTIKDGVIGDTVSRDEDKYLVEYTNNRSLDSLPYPDWNDLKGAVEVADFYYGFSSEGSFTPHFAHINDPSLIDTVVFPRIVNIMYAPPGSGSSVTIANSTTISTSASITANYSTGGAVSMGFEIDPDALTGYFGTESEVSVGYDHDWGSAETFDYEQTITREINIEGGDGDHVLMEELTAYMTVVRRKKHPFLFDQSDNDNTYVAVLLTVPGKLSAVEKLPVSEFLDKYQNRQDVLDYFGETYAKDLKTGVVRNYLPHLVEADNLTITGGVGADVLQDGITATNTKTQTFSHAIATSISSKITTVGLSVGGEAEFSFTTTAENSQSTTTEFAATYELCDPESWDRIVMKQYLDTINGVRIFSPITAQSYTSNPHESLTQPASEFGYMLKESSDPLIVGEASRCTLTVTNTTVNPWAKDGLLPRINALGIYNNSDYEAQIIPDPKTVVLNSGQSADFYITYTPLHRAAVPMNLSLEYGYATGPNTIEVVGTNAISATALPQVIAGVVITSSIDTQRVAPADSFQVTFPLCITNIGMSEATIISGVNEQSQGVSGEIGSYTNPVDSGDSLNTTVTFTCKGSYIPFTATCWAHVAGETATREEIMLTVDTLSGATHIAFSTKTTIRELGMNITRDGKACFAVPYSMKPAQFRMYSMQGRQILSTHLSAGHRVIDLRSSGIAGGMYILRLQQGKNLIQRKMVLSGR